MRHPKKTISSVTGRVIVTAQPPGPVTELLAAVGRGDVGAHEQLWALVYDELHRIAHRQMAGEAPGRTLQTTVLVNEAYLRLIGDENVQWANRRHFFAAAARAMRRIRIDDARRRNALKRGGIGATKPRSHEATQGGTEASFGGVQDGLQREAVEGGSVGVPPAGSVPHPQRGWGTPAEGPAVFDQDPSEVLAVDEALGRLEQTDPRTADVVMLRYFAGLTIDETANALDVSPRTVDNEWRLARAWLHRELSDE